MPELKFVGNLELHVLPMAVGVLCSLTHRSLNHSLTHSLPNTAYYATHKTILLSLKVFLGRRNGKLLPEMT